MKKLMVIGIDGVPWELVRHYTRTGMMPESKRILDRYELRKMQVPLPEISAVSWTSFMTGQNPGDHGIFGFMDIDGRNYGYRFPTFKTFAGKPLWEKIGPKGYRSMIINLPNTYPARELNGVMVSGFVALDLEKAVYPPTMFPLMEQLDYQVDVDTKLAHTEEKLFFNQLGEILETRFKLYQELKKDPWDLFFFIITGTDRLNHYFFDAWKDENNPYHHEFTRYYRQVDRIVGRIAGDMEEKGIPYIILSDHGFEEIKKEVYLAQYLKDWGYLEFTENNPRNLKHLAPASRIFPLDPTRLYVHLRDRYSRGPVPQAEYLGLCREIKERLLGLRIDGETVISQVHHKEEIYNGKYMSRAPDLVVLGNTGFDIKAGITKKQHYIDSQFRGKHRWDNAFVIDACGLELTVPLTIDSVGKKIEDYF